MRERALQYSAPSSLRTAKRNAFPLCPFVPLSLCPSPRHPATPTNPTPGRTNTTFVYPTPNPIRHTFRSVATPGRELIVTTRTPAAAAATLKRCAISACWIPLRR